jgi:hypothetical protein
MTRATFFNLMSLFRRLGCDCSVQVLSKPSEKFSQLLRFGVGSSEVDKCTPILIF